MDDAQILKKLILISDLIDEACGNVPCPYCLSVKRMDHAPECCEHEIDCELQQMYRLVRQKVK